MQAAEITPISDRTVPSAAAWHYLQRPSYNASCSRMDHSIAAGDDASTLHVFCPWWPWSLTFDLDIQTIPEGNQTRLPCEFGANLISASRGIWFTNKKLEAKDVLPNIKRTLAAVWVTLLPCCLFTPITPRQQWNGPTCCCVTLFAANALQCIFNGEEICPWCWPWHSNSCKWGTKHVFMWI